MGSFKLFLHTNFKDTGAQSGKKTLTFTMGGESSSLKEDLVIDKDTSLSVTLLGYSLHKPVYAPCRLDITLQFSGKADISLCKEIITCLDKAAVDLTYISGDTSRAVASDYYVYQVNPTYIPIKRTPNITVRLVAYSKDHLLTLENGSQAFTAQQFVNEIFRADNENICSGRGVEINRDTHLQCLSLVTTANDGKVTETEVIQPYLVQYDEPYYNFLARTANRCGELMYFEEGKLCIGLKWYPGNLEAVELQTSTPTSISLVNLTSLTPQFASIYPETAFNDSDVGKYADSLSVTDEVATDEYIFKIKQGEWTTFEKKYVGSYEKKFVGWIPALLNNEGLSKMISKLATDEADAAIVAKIKADEENSKSDKLYFDPIRKEQRSADGKQAYPFTSDFGESDMRAGINLPYLTTHAFYSRILQCERQVSTQAIEINFGTSYQHFLLGDVIKLDDVKYLVTDIKAEVSCGTSTTQSYKLTAIPLYTVDNGNGKSEAQVFAIPPLYAGGHIRKSGVQRAFIYETNDPLKRLRVRIRYPWQKVMSEAVGAETDGNRATSSPWIRYATDYTADGGGVCFHSYKGTEVLVDYENGNVEHPYIIGALYNAKSKAPGNTSEHQITSKHKHSIKFKDPSDNGAFVAGLWGGWGFLTKYIPAFLDISKKLCSDMDKLSGGIDITDYYGFYSISMSTDKRSVKIASPFGTVDVNAFSGITISAPNGDVKIVGKNVSIVANNNLTLTSGQNIKNRFDDNLVVSKNKKQTAKDDLEGFGKQMLEGVVKGKILKPFIDLSLLRKLFEAFVKPVEGTLKVKSFRYLMLEAGKGSSQIPVRAYSKLDPVKDEMAIFSDINRITQQVHKFVHDAVELHKNIRTKRNALDNLLTNHSFSDDARTTRRTPAQVKGALDTALTSPFPDPDYGHMEDVHLTDAQTQWAGIKVEAQKYFNDIPADIRTNCISTGQNTKFTDEAQERGDKVVERLQNDIKTYLNGNKAVKVDPAAASWDAYVNSLELAKKSQVGSYLLGQLLDAVAGSTSAEDIKRTFLRQVWSANSAGEILLSNEKAHTMTFNEGRLESKANISGDAIISYIKEALRSIR